MFWKTKRVKQLEADVARLERILAGVRVENSQRLRQVLALESELRSATIKQRLLQDEPGKGASKLSKTLAAKPDAKRVVRETYGRSSIPAAPPAPAPDNSVNNFLLGALTGIVVDEIFRSDPPSSSPAPADPPSYDSGGGGDFGGGGSSGDY